MRSPRETPFPWLLVVTDQPKETTVSDEVADRFWAKVVQVGDCWLWTGDLVKGYGRFRLPTMRVMAHRWAYESMVAPVPAGLQIDHLCRNKACVNPWHLEPVTAQVNSMRAVQANAAKTKCLSGHPYDTENTYIRADGERVCRACQRRRDRARYRRRKEARAVLLVMAGVIGLAVATGSPS